jgi:hypothetical protein
MPLLAPTHPVVIHTTWEKALAMAQECDKACFGYTEDAMRCSAFLLDLARGLREAQKAAP